MGMHGQGRLRRIGAEVSMHSLDGANAQPGGIRQASARWAARRLIPYAQRRTFHRRSLPLQCLDLAAEEAVTDFGVVVDGRGDLQRKSYLYSMMSDPTPRTRSQLNLIWPSVSGNLLKTRAPACSQWRAVGRPFFVASRITCRG